MIKLKSVYKYLGYVLLSSITFGTIAQAQQFELETETNPVFIQYDAKTYPGISCEAQIVAEIDEFHNFQFNMGNANPGKRTVVCPIVRDNTKNNNGTLGVYVNVHNAANRTLECALYSNDRFGSIIDLDTNSTSDSGNQTIYLDVNNSVDGGYYGIHCELAYGASIVSYKVHEYLDTDKDNTSLTP